MPGRDHGLAVHFPGALPTIGQLWSSKCAMWEIRGLGWRDLGLFARLLLLQLIWLPCPPSGTVTTVIYLNTMPVLAYFWDDVNGFP